jgi:two-component system C4-dicarboxylate transport sensor histidine kinase DctB
MRPRASASLCMLILVGAAIVTLLRASSGRQLRQAAHEALEREVAARTRRPAHRQHELRLSHPNASVSTPIGAIRAAREELAQAKPPRLDRPDHRRRRARDQPAGRRDPHLCRKQPALSRTRAARSKARSNLDTIVELTARIGAITNELRNFARRRRPRSGPFALQIGDRRHQLLIGDRLRAQW